MKYTFYERCCCTSLLPLGAAVKQRWTSCPHSVTEQHNFILTIKHRCSGTGQVPVGAQSSPDLTCLHDTHITRRSHSYCSVCSAATRYRIGPLCQSKPTHRTHQDVVPTPMVGVGVTGRVRVRWVSASYSSIRCVR